MSARCRGVLLLAALLWPTVSRAALRFALVDLDGRTHTEAELTAAPLTVFVYLSNDCPIANAYAPELRRLTARYAHVKFWGVHADASESRADIQAHARAYALPFSILLDPQEILARQLGVSAVPTAAVVDNKGNILYVGRIDDRNVDLGQRRTVVGEHSLADALDAALAGSRTPHRTPVVGCSLPRVPS